MVLPSRQLTAGRNKGVICKNFYDLGACPIVNCPYAHHKEGVELPMPTTVCQFHGSVKCKKDDCKAFHGTTQEFLKLRRSNAATYKPQDYMEIRDPLDLESTDGVSNEQPPAVWPPPVPLPPAAGQRNAGAPAAFGASGSSGSSYAGSYSGMSSQNSSAAALSGSSFMHMALPPMAVPSGPGGAGGLPPSPHGAVPQQVMMMPPSMPGQQPVYFFAPPGYPQPPMGFVPSMQGMVPLQMPMQMAPQPSSAPLPMQPAAFGAPPPGSAYMYPMYQQQPAPPPQMYYVPPGTGPVPFPH